MHLGAGQEAIAVGLADHFLCSDAAFGAHRSHAQFLALGGEVRKLFGEVLGKSTGASKGMGGSMHLWGGNHGFHGSVPIVAGSVPIAVGAALAFKLRDERNIAVAFLGDGAMEEGVVHEAMNFAKINQLPILFFVENNLFASHMHISDRQPFLATARFAEANGIDHQIIDGNDVVQVSRTCESVVSNMRSQSHPYFLDARTDRHYGHVDWRIDLDVGINRSTEDLANWHLRDPITRLKSAIVKQHESSIKSLEQIERDTSSFVEIEWAAAMNDPFPNPEVMAQYLYSDNR